VKTGKRILLGVSIVLKVYGINVAAAYKMISLDLVKKSIAPHVAFFREVKM